MDLERHFSYSSTGYFSSWRRRAESRPYFSDKMLLSKATEEGVIITSKSMSNLVKDCLKYVAPYIITRRCNQGKYLIVVDTITAVNCCCVGRGEHLRRNNCGASLRRNYFTCDSACATIIFKRLRWRLRHKYFSNFERKSNTIVND